MRIRCTYCNWVGTERELLVRPSFSEVLAAGSMVCVPSFSDDDDRCPRCEGSDLVPNSAQPLAA